MQNKILIRKVAVLALTALLCAAPIIALRGGARLRPENPIETVSDAAPGIEETSVSAQEELRESELPQPSEDAPPENDQPFLPAAPQDDAAAARQIAAQPQAAEPVPAQGAVRANTTVFALGTNGKRVASDTAVRLRTPRPTETVRAEAAREEVTTAAQTPAAQAAQRDPVQDTTVVPHLSTTRPTKPRTTTNPSTQTTVEPTTEIATDPEPEPDIRTNLGAFAVILQEDCPDGALSFYAYGVNGKDLTVGVRWKARDAAGNPQILVSADSRNYQCTLQLAETYDFFLTLYNAEKTALKTESYTVTYQATLADEHHTRIGTSVSLSTNFDHITNGYTTENACIALKVTARAQPHNTPLYADSIRVVLTDRETQRSFVIAAAQDGENPEYDLVFEAPNKGDYREYKIEVTAWHGADSAYWSRTVRYHAVSDGTQTGVVHMKLDATVLGLDVLDAADVPLVQGETAAHAVLRFLQEYDYTVKYAGAPNNGFYIRSISRAGISDGASVPPELRQMLSLDGIALHTDDADPDSLAEHDFTVKSGWMYAVNGVIYSRGLSAMKLSNGDRVSLRFTLAGGKDVGAGPVSDGKLRSYCGVWADGKYTALPHEPKGDGVPTEDGRIEYICRNCGQTYYENAETGDTHAQSDVVWFVVPAAVLPAVRLCAKRRIR